VGKNDGYYTIHPRTVRMEIDDNLGARLIQAYQRKLIDGCHILHHRGLLDAYGHLSFRHPLDPDVFVMSRSMAPGIVSSPDDLVEYAVPEAEAFDPSSPEGYAERRIHSEIYKRHGGVQAVVHCESDAVAPYTVTSVPLRACVHAAGFLGSEAVPVCDPAALYDPDNMPDVMERHANLAYELAKLFDNDNSVVLMRSQGFTVVAENLELAVMRAIYTQKNAAVQTAALTISAAAEPSGKSDMNKIRFLNEREALESANTTRWSAHRPWKLLVREVEASGLYVNYA